jgi:hypothetical protein
VINNFFQTQNFVLLLILLLLAVALLVVKIALITLARALAIAVGVAAVLPMLLKEESNVKVLIFMAGLAQHLTLLMEPWPAIQALVSSILVDAIILPPIVLMAKRMLLAKAVMELT